MSCTWRGDEEAIRELGARFAPADDDDRPDDDAPAHQDPGVITRTPVQTPEDV